MRHRRSPHRRTHPASELASSSCVTTTIICCECACCDVRVAAPLPLHASPELRGPPPLWVSRAFSLALARARALSSHTPNSYWTPRPSDHQWVCLCCAVASRLADWRISLPTVTRARRSRSRSLLVWLGYGCIYVAFLAVHQPSVDRCVPPWFPKRTRVRTVGVPTAGHTDEYVAPSSQTQAPTRQSAVRRACLGRRSSARPRRGHSMGAVGTPARLTDCVIGSHIDHSVVCTIPIYTRMKTHVAQERPLGGSVVYPLRPPTCSQYLRRGAPYAPYLFCRGRYHRQSVVWCDHTTAR